LPEGLTAEDLATLVLLYLLQVGEKAAKADAAKYHAEPQILFTTGAPMGGLQDLTLQALYVRMARTAFEAFRNGFDQLDRGIQMKTCRELLQNARASATGKAPGFPREWVRSEAESALLWFFWSPHVRPNLYAAVDIGAGTTDVSFFRVVEAFDEGRWRPARLAFYGAVAGPPGMDSIGSVLSEAHGLGDHSATRGIENDLFERSTEATTKEVARVMSEIFAQYKEAFRAAFPKQKLQSVWDPYKVFLLGGGSRFHPLVKAFLEPPWKQLEPRTYADPGKPVDLTVPPLAQIDPDFLLVAYGLSRDKGEIPLVDGPDDVKPLDLTHSYDPPYAQEEAYRTDS
jgi:hypothetical protein